MAEALEAWIERQRTFAVSGVLASISRTDLVKTRAGFGQTIRAARGSVLASPILADYDPDPDYFYHWFRDSAIVIDSLRKLRCVDADLTGPALEAFSDYVDFSLRLASLDGAALTQDESWRRRIQSDYAQFARPTAELTAVRGDSVIQEARVNPDGSLDVQRWARPQNDGPASRALTVLNWLKEKAYNLGADLICRAETLLSADLEFTQDHWSETCFDIWEEERASHYYTLRMQAAALSQGAKWSAAKGDLERAAAFRDSALKILEELDSFWIEDERAFRSRKLDGGLRSAKELDIAVILAAIHGGGDASRHSVRDPRSAATLLRLEDLFRKEYSINHPAVADAPAMGRYPQDQYYSGGAYYFSTLAAAEFYFRAGAAQLRGADGRVDRTGLAKGDAFLQTVRRFTPETGDMSEQFDQTTGAQTSAKHLAWSYAAFILCVDARNTALRVQNA